MAAKKRAPAKAKASPRAKGAAPRAAAPARSAAVALLGQLPAIDARLRLAFRATVPEDRCAALGERTSAKEVLKEAVAALPVLRKAVEKGPAGGYSSRRLAFLAELVVALEDELAAGGGAGVRTSTLTWARGLRADLLLRLRTLAGHRPELKEQVERRAGGDGAVHQVRDALTGLIELATRWRRDPLMELLADDADLTTARLGAAYNALEALARTDEVLREVVSDGSDSAGVNAIEGRILAELELARGALDRARAAGSAVGPLKAGPQLKKAFATEAP